MYWTNVCVEAFCFAETNEDGCAPCGRNVPSPFCMRNGHCPYFAWCGTTEREAAKFVPLRKLILDRTKMVFSNTCDTLGWFFWGQLWFVRRKFERQWKEIMDNSHVITDKECPELAEEEKVNKAKFLVWHEQARKEAKEEGEDAHS